MTYKWYISIILVVFRGKGSSIAFLFLNWWLIFPVDHHIFKVRPLFHISLQFIFLNVVSFHIGSYIIAHRVEIYCLLFYIIGGYIGLLICNLSLPRENLHSCRLLLKLWVFSKILFIQRFVTSKVKENLLSFRFLIDKFWNILISKIIMG